VGTRGKVGERGGRGKSETEHVPCASTMASSDTVPRGANTDHVQARPRNGLVGVVDGTDPSRHQLRLHDVPPTCARCAKEETNGNTAAGTKIGAVARASRAARPAATGYAGRQPPGRQKSARAPVGKQACEHRGGVACVRRDTCPRPPRQQRRRHKFKGATHATATADWLRVALFVSVWNCTRIMRP